jgi:hypothetical protein
MEETEEREGNPNLEKPNRNVSVEDGRSVSVCVPGVSLSEDRLGPKQRKVSRGFSCRIAARHEGVLQLGPYLAR